MDFEKFAPFIHESWYPKLRKWIESEECDKIYEFLKKETGRGKKLAPLSSNVWKAFLLTPYEEVKVVMVGMAPYHTFTRDNLPVADGILMGCSITKQLQPSLEQFYSAMEKELGVEIEKTPDLSYLCRQGVLMLNLALTTEKNKPGNHIPLWNPFIKYLFEEVLLTSGIPVVLLGKEASKVKRYLSPFTWTLEVSHPASSAYSGGEWDSEGIFGKINTILKNNNGYEIKWYNEK